MAWFERTKSKPSRVDPRKFHSLGLRTRLVHYILGPGNLMRLVPLLVLVLGTVALLHLPYEPMRYARGMWVKGPVFARVSFVFHDTVSTEIRRQEAARNSPNVYVRTTEQTDLLRQEFDALLMQAQEAAARKGLDETTAKDTAPANEAAEPAPAASPEKPSDDAPATTRPDYASAWKVRDRFDEFISLVADAARLQRVRDAMAALLAFNDTFAVLPAAQAAEYPARILVVPPNGDIALPSLVTRESGLLLDHERLPDRQAYRDKIAAKVEETFRDTGLGKSVRDAIAARFVETLRANLTLNDDLTRQQRQIAAQRVPETTEQKTKGAPLVEDSKPIDDRTFDLLSQEHDAYQQSLGGWARLGAIGGSFTLVSLLACLLAAYTGLYQPNVAEKPVRAAMLVALFLLVMLVTKFFSTHLHRSMLIFPLTTAAMIVAVAYNRRYALVTTWFLILLCTMVARIEDYSVVVLLVIGTSVAVLQMGDIRSRSKLISVGLVTGLAYFIAVWGLELLSFRLPDRALALDTLDRSGMAFFAGLLPGFIILGVLPFLERIFGVVTAISLLELCDINHPALRRLAIEAPGTYSHSLLLGSLVEPACAAIGANGLLARVGAYFHDIGKVNKPQYFIENVDTTGGPSEHARLTPAMSKLIITSHIKDGLEMARRYGLPRIINPFIAEHHGTTVIQYFYNEARKAAGEDEIVDDVQYRYGGPKPQSKETAILMLTDAAEGAVRSIKEPTAPKIEDKVHEVVMSRLLDGQLNECGLTIEEVFRVEQSLCKSLISVHHGRIPYPGDREPKTPAGDQSSQE